MSQSSERDFVTSEEMMETQQSNEKLKELEPVKKYSPEEELLYREKKAIRDARKRLRPTPAQVRMYLRHPSDSLVIICGSSQYPPALLLETYLPYLGLSKPFVIYCEFLEPLMACQHTLQQSPAILHLEITATWTRNIQVLPNRTHPEMTMSSCGGYLLSGIKICPRTTEA